MSELGAAVSASPRRFRYLRDPLFLSAVGLYLLNRYVVKPATGDASDFFHCHLNDLLCLPFWLPPILWINRGLGIRRHDAPPTVGELMLFLLLWSWLFEVIAPAPALNVLLPHAVGDAWDIVAYAAGAAISAWLWHSRWEHGPAALPGSRPRLHAAVAAAIMLLAMATAILLLSQNAWQEAARRARANEQLESVAREIGDFRREHHRLPIDLHELQPTVPLAPLLYIVCDDGFRLIHLGDDAREGGRGSNRDVHYPSALQPPIPWSDYFFTDDGRDAIAAGSMLGALVAGLWLARRWRKRPAFPPLDEMSICLGLLGTGMVLFAGLFILLLQNSAPVESGH